VIVDGERRRSAGVTVTATSTALQVKEVSVVSNERGEYRISPLPIGTYTVTYTLVGLSSPPGTKTSGSPSGSRPGGYDPIPASSAAARIDSA